MQPTLVQSAKTLHRAPLFAPKCTADAPQMHRFRDFKPPRKLFVH
jgi:hypothetical protein